MPSISRHSTWQLGILLAIGILLGIKLGNRHLYQVIFTNLCVYRTRLIGTQLETENTQTTDAGSESKCSIEIGKDEMESSNTGDASSTDTVAEETGGPTIVSNDRKGMPPDKIINNRNDNDEITGTDTGTTSSKLSLEMENSTKPETSAGTSITMITSSEMTRNSGFKMKIQPTMARKRKRVVVTSAAAASKDIFGAADNETTEKNDSNKNRILLSADQIINSYSDNDKEKGMAEINNNNDTTINNHNHSNNRISMSLSGSSSASSSDDDDGDDTSPVAALRTSNEVYKGTYTRKHLQNDDTRIQPRKAKRHTHTHDVDDVSTQTNEISKMDDNDIDDDDEVLNSMRKGQADKLRQVKVEEKQPNQFHQQEGWRVKLYRLNADGSWDDCGTGRIFCMYKPKPNKDEYSYSDSGGGRKSSASTAVTTTTTTTAIATNDNDNKFIEDEVNKIKSNNTNENLASSSIPLSNPATIVTETSVFQELGEPTLCMHSEVSAVTASASPTQQQHKQEIICNNADDTDSDSTTNQNLILLRTRILLREPYQRQGENIITWCEPHLEEGNTSQGVDLALSFQDNSGCIDIWRQITDVQSKANECFRSKRVNCGSGNNNNSIEGGDNNNGNSTAANNNTIIGIDIATGESLADLAHNVAVAQHENLQRQELWVNVPADDKNKQFNNTNCNSSNSNNVNGDNNDGNDQFEDDVGGMVAVYHDSISPGGGSSALNAPTSPQLPNPPTLNALEEILDTIAGVQHIQQRESVSMYIAQNDCYYLKSLLSLFPPTEESGDYGSLATLAACVKTILLLNDPSIIELVVTDELVFEDVCSTLEYDPDLRDKANHRWFLQERAKFRTVALMEDEELVGAIHRSFRVNYLKDTLLRPTMDENSLSTLSSLQTFTHADVVKGVTMSPIESDDRGDLLRDSYLAKIIRILGHEMDAICESEWKDLEVLESEKDVHVLLTKQHEEPLSDTSTLVASGKYPQSQNMPTKWKQHLAPQDSSLASRRQRRRGSLSFLRELFNMVRVSLHQTDKDDFFAVLVSMEVDLSYEKKSLTDTTNPEEVNNNKDRPLENCSKPVNFLLLLATALSDPETDVTDKGLVLEIIAGIAMHDPSLIRRKCLDFYACCKAERSADIDSEKMTGLTKPMPNGKKQVIFQCPPNDLLASLLFLLAMDTDAGVLLQVSEIMRIILDTDVISDNNRPMNTGFADEPEGIPPSGGHNPLHDQHPKPTASENTASTEQNQFLSVFYDHYVQWLAAPFQYTILYPVLRFPEAIFFGKKKSRITDVMVQRFENGDYQEDPLLHKIAFNALRSSLAVELLSFCVRAHQYRMKVYLLRSRVLGNVLKLIKPSSIPRFTSGDRCLKLAALRFLRAVLSVDEDSYYRHIVQDDLFGPVFEAFRANPVGDNIVSSSIVEMCDFINQKNIFSLIEYIATRHLSTTGIKSPSPSLEDVSSPYVNTLTCLRHAYEKLLKDKTNEADGNECFKDADNSGRVVMNEKALEDQRKFKEVDHEESYFDCDDEDEHETDSNTRMDMDKTAKKL